jgi:hypothetical protein
MLRPYVYRSGVVVFRKRQPADTLPVACPNVPGRLATVNVLCRHGRPEFGQSRKLMLMPGVPEAATERQALRALARFEAFLAKALAARSKRSRRHA